MPRLTGIDHIHVYVPSREQAAEWFEEVLGLKVIEKFRAWAENLGPLTIGNAEDTVHLALFEKADFKPMTNIAFRADAEDFIAWKIALEQRGMAVRCTDHRLAWSLYFEDPWQNMYEITCYEHEDVANDLGDRSTG